MFRLTPTLKLHLLTIIIIVSIFTFALIYHFLDSFTETEQFTNTQSKNDFFEKLYFSVVVQSTAGFGDIYPKSGIARVLVMAQLLSTILVVLYVAPFIDTKVVQSLDRSIDHSLQQISGKTIKSYKPHHLLN